MRLKSVWMDRKCLVHTPRVASVWTTGQRSPFFLSLPSYLQVSLYVEEERRRKSTILGHVFSVVITETTSPSVKMCNDALCHLIFEHFERSKIPSSTFAISRKDTFVFESLNGICKSRAENKVH